MPRVCAAKKAILGNEGPRDFRVSRVIRAIAVKSDRSDPLDRKDLRVKQETRA